uniref:Immunoglobulin V-set domain-containing protein n=1 Tax=Callorhinchus milii TaxID=7868 RepID=A0A4W3GT55_CALMI
DSNTHHSHCSKKCVVVAFAEINGQDVVSQYPREKTEMEGQDVALNCNISRLATVFWYRQNPGGALHYALRIFSSGTVDKSPDLPERFTAEYTSPRLVSCLSAHSSLLN